MIAARTFGRQPTLAEMKAYYAREDVLDFLYDECQRRNIDLAYRRKRWPIEPTSKTHLREIIDNAIETKIEKDYREKFESSAETSALEDIRLEKYDYLSFHFHTSITDGKKLVGFDLIFEADMQGWRRAFEDLYGVVKLLDDFEVCYRIKYSGVRSLHLMIPFESFPKQFNGKSILEQRNQIHDKIRNYFRRHGGMEKAHGGGVMRLAYSLNEDNGIVSLPILPHQLSDFRPWMANIYNVRVDKPWHGDIPANANRKMLRFLREVYNDDLPAPQGTSRQAGAKVSKRKSVTISYGPACAGRNACLCVAPRNYSNYSANVSEFTIDKCLAQLKSDDAATRAEAAWHLMVSRQAIPISILKKALTDDSADVRWFLAESLQKHIDADAVSLAGQLLWDEDQFVRISAIDALVSAGEGALNALSNAMFSDVSASMDSLNDVIYAIHKICPQKESGAVQSFIASSGDAVAHFIQNAIDSGQPFWRVRGYIRQLRGLCKQYSLEESVLFAEAIKILAPRLLKSFSRTKAEYHHISTLREIRKNDGIPLMTMRQIADSFGIDSVKIPSNRMTDEEREFLTGVVRDSLADMTVEQKARILVIFMIHGNKKLSEPARNLLLNIDKWAAVAAIREAIANQEIGQHRIGAVADLLVQLAPSAAQSISSWIDEADIQIRMAAGASANIAVEKNIDELVEMLNHPSRTMRMTAASVLGRKCKSEGEINKVIAVLGHKNHKARVAAVLALSEVKNSELAVWAIRQSLDDSHLKVRRAALQRYIRQNPPDAVETLLNIIERRDSWQVKFVAVRALARYLDDERVPQILRQIQDDARFHQRIRTLAEKIIEMQDAE